MTAQGLLENLEDAGCGPEVTERFWALESAGQHQEQLKLLSDHRRHLLDCLHREERRIDCLDYLVYQMESAAPENPEPHRYWRSCYDDYSESDL